MSQPEPLTEQQLDEIAGRVNAVSSGPWTLSEDYSDVLAPDGSQLASYWLACDGEFIAAARQDVPALLAEVRRLAAEERDEQQAQQGAHSCGNCEGVDPDTCWMNPNRPPEQCPAAEFEDYGQQCQKPVGHELHTFEERQSTTPPAVVAEPGKENSRG